MRKFFPYHLGLIIPCTIILLNGGTTYFSVILFGSERSRILFLLAYACVWLSYGLAIFVKPGYTLGEKYEDGLYIECSKCHKPKPERAHHCRICKRCVLQMDHHCPWTENCVGHNNLATFLRFLLSAVLLNLYGAYRTGAFLLYLIQNWRFKARILPNNNLRLWLAITGLIGDVFIALTMGILVLRLLMDCSQGQTQIESWERDRVHMLWRRKLAPKREFPFDIGLFENLESFFGSPTSWLLPWGRASGSGHVFSKIFPTTERWPPKDSEEVQNHEYYRADRWVNFEGEALFDFGVDAKDEDDIPLSEISPST